MKIKGYIIGLSSVDASIINQRSLTCLWFLQDTGAEYNLIQIFIPQIPDDMLQNLMKHNLNEKITTFDPLQLTSVDMIPKTGFYSGQELEIEFEPYKKVYFADASKSIKIDNVEIKDMKNKVKNR